MPLQIQQINPNLVSANNTQTGQILTFDGNNAVWDNGLNTYYLDDISTSFDGFRTSFPLTYNNGANSITPTSPYQLQIYIGNVPVLPSRAPFDYHNLPEVSLFNSGFLVYDSVIVFASPPQRGLGFSGTFINNRYQQQVYTKSKQIPFTALSIMLGP